MIAAHWKMAYHVALMDDFIHCGVSWFHRSLAFRLEVVGFKLDNDQQFDLMRYQLSSTG